MTFFEIVDMLKQRYQIKNLTLVPFDPNMECLPCPYDDHEGLPRIFLLDSDGSFVALVTKWDTVIQTIDELDDEMAKEVVYVLDLEIEEISVVPIYL